MLSGQACFCAFDKKFGKKLYDGNEKCKVV